MKINHIYHTFQVEDFLQDDVFFKVVKDAAGGNPTQWNEFLDQFPEKHAVMQEAYSIINGININKEKISAQQVEISLNVLKQRIKKQQRKRLIYISGSVAACLIVALFGIYILLDAPQGNFDDKMFMTLKNTEIGSDSISIRYGKSSMTLGGNKASIEQDENGIMLVNSNEKIAADKDEFIHLTVPYGKHTSVTFSDGTRAWVNSGSKLTYPSIFDAKKRELYVIGEVYLEVKKDPSRPFFVKTETMDVKVLGTSFNVCAYNDDNFANVVLVNGSVEVITDKKQKNTLTPNDHLNYQDGKVSVKKVDVSYYIGWKDGFVKLSKDPMANIFKRLSRYYNVNIIYDSRYANIGFNGKLDLTGSIENALDNLSFMKDLTYVRNGNEIRIMFNE